MVTKTLTVVFTDINGFTARTARSSRAEMISMLQKHEDLLKPLVLRHGGTVVKTIGDAFLLTFESPTNAVLCALRMQARLKEHNAGVSPKERIDIRIAMDSGEVEIVGNDVFGEPVNLASRVEGITKTGEIYFTETTYRVMNKQEAPTSQVGEFRFKGIPESIRVYRVVQDENLDLYRKVVASQEVYDEVEPEDANVPEGTLSTSLLYALQQQQAMMARRRMDPILWAVAMVVLLLLVGAGYWGVRVLQYRSQRAKAEQLIADGHLKEALDLLAILRTERPADGKARELFNHAVETDIRRLISEQRFEETLRRIEDYRKTYPNLPMLGRLVRDTRLAKVEHMYESNYREAHRMLEQLTKEYPQDLEIKFRYAYHNAETFDIGLAMYLYQQIVEANPDEYKDNEAVLKAVFKYLNSHGEKDRLDFIAREYYDQIKPYLLEHVADPGSKGGNLRRNAYVILKERGDLTPIDEFRFFTAELFYRSTAERGYLEESLTYFENLLENGLTAEIKNYTPGELPVPPILRSPSRYTNRALPILKAFFPDLMENLRK